ncbi:MAG: hypothetical protein FWB96_11620 [Defluviitaleaceae bacterium]|nr:hypothetical protein [Defluviitaleaceae bacterium]MCL2263090.1 hypothetical protein [Defluviitaleaceae bacterium]
MKNILIWGAARAGKSTLAKRLHDEFGHSIVCTDSIITAFERSMPQVEIGHGFNNVAVNFAPFISHYLCTLAHKSNMPNGDKFVAALTHFAVGKVFPKMEEILHSMEGLKLHEEFTLIGLTYNHKTWEDLRRDVKQYDTENDWTHQLTDTELDDFCKGSVEQHNKYFAAKFKEYNFLSYDVSFERDKVLMQIINDIKIKV